MKVANLHSWQVTIAEAQEIQRNLALKVLKENKVSNPRLIAGVDISAPSSRGIACGAVVILDYPALRIIETQTIEGELSFPYIPGLLSFRESPLILKACERLRLTPDLFIVDGQGIAHPRRFGLASHLGLLLDAPTIGCAKSRLYGYHQSIGAKTGSYTELIDDNNEVIGAALRTKEREKPVYVSVGHKIDLNSSIFWVMTCCQNYRLPEPIRLAHLAANSTPRGKGGKSSTLSREAL